MKNKEPNILYRDFMNLLTQSNEIIRLQNELIKYYKKLTTVLYIIIILLNITILIVELSLTK